MYYDLSVTTSMGVSGTGVSWNQDLSSLSFTWWFSWVNKVKRYLSREGGAGPSVTSRPQKTKFTQKFHDRPQTRPFLFLVPTTPNHLSPMNRTHQSLPERRLPWKLDSRLTVRPSNVSRLSSLKVRLLGQSLFTVQPLLAPPKLLVVPRTTPISYHEFPLSLFSAPV